jgi:hypothetical protein
LQVRYNLFELLYGKISNKRCKKIRMSAEDASGEAAAAVSTPLSSIANYDARADLTSSYLKNALSIFLKSMGLNLLSFVKVRVIQINSG